MESVSKIKNEVKIKRRYMCIRKRKVIRNKNKKNINEQSKGSFKLKRVVEKLTSRIGRRSVWQADAQALFNNIYIHTCIYVFTNRTRLPHRLSKVNKMQNALLFILVV